MMTQAGMYCWGGWLQLPANFVFSAGATTRNHFHVGSAGQWTRKATDAGLIGIAVSSHRYPLPPGAAAHQGTNSAVKQTSWG